MADQHYQTPQLPQAPQPYKAPKGPKTPKAPKATKVDRPYYMGKTPIAPKTPQLIQVNQPFHPFQHVQINQTPKVYKPETGAVYFASAATAGTGTFADPYGPAQAQAAFDAGHRKFICKDNATLSGINTGAGTVTLTLKSLTGEGSIGNIVSSGGTLTVRGETRRFPVANLTGAAGQTLDLFLIRVENIYCVGDNGTDSDGVTPSTPGTAGGIVYLHGVTVDASVAANGGAGGRGFDANGIPGGTGGDGGTVTILSSSVVETEPLVQGGEGGGADSSDIYQGSPGADGAWSAFGSRVAGTDYPD